MTWIPISPMLFEVSDLATELDYFCSFDPSPSQTVISYSWEMTPEPPERFSISSSTAGVRLTSGPLAGMFPIRFIDYRDGDKVKRVLSWDDLPLKKDVVEFRPSSVPLFEYTITVTVTYSEVDELIGTETEHTDTQAWQCVVTHDYSSGRAKLLEYMTNASSD